MHNLSDPKNTLDRNIIESSELLGRECATCQKILPLNYFKADHTYRDGRYERCTECESTPWLSIDENTSRLREMNYNSEALKRQRPPWIESMKCDIGRVGRVMDSLAFLNKLKTLVPDLYWLSGNFAGDFSVYLRDSREESGLRYLWYVPQGVIPEYSLHEFDDRDVPIKEKMRGWRTPLLRCILADMITEAQANDTFGPPADGLASQVYRARLWAKRNNTTV